MAHAPQPTSAQPAGLPAGLMPAGEESALFEGVPYEDFWDDPQRTRQDALEQYLIGKLLPANGRRIVDLGCGYGRLTPLYLDRFTEAVLFDGSLSLLKSARERFGDGVIAVAGDVRRVPFKDGAFDCALAIRVLQHLRDPAEALGEAHRVLAADGELIASFHNKRNARRVLHYLTGRPVASPFSAESVEVSPALISRHPRRFDSLMRNAGFATPEYQGALVIGALAGGDGVRDGRPPGARWAGVTGQLRLAPWLIGKARLDESALHEKVPWPQDLLCCPVCRSDLEDGSSVLQCSRCKRDFPVVDGVYDFRL